jgi:hypothetical protein
METSFGGGESQSIRREPLTLGKQLVNFITSDCESRRGPISIMFVFIVKHMKGYFKIKHAIVK